MPNRIFGKYKEMGLADYFVKGIPFEKFGENLWRGVNAADKERVKTMNGYLECFFDRLQVMRDNFREGRIHERAVSNKPVDNTSTRYSDSADRDKKKFVRHHALLGRGSY